MHTALSSAPDHVDRDESLFFKSSVTSATTPANAVLCTETTTYQVRQVHSSNSIFVLQPSEIASDTSDENTIPQAGLSAIARCTTTLELIPAALPALALLKSKLPVYDSPRTGLPSEEPANTVDACDERDKSAIYQDTPLSLQEFEKAWEELCAFEMDSTSWIPTAASLRGAWLSIMSALTLKGLKLQDSIYVDDIVGLVQEDGIPVALFQAIINRLHLEKVIPMDGCRLCLNLPDIPYSAEDGIGATLSPDKCVPWVGAVILNSESHLPEGIARSDFMQQWQNLLPEAWREHATLSLLNVGLVCALCLPSLVLMIM